MALREFTWCVDAGATQDTELVTNTVKFGDGYEQVSSFGINNKRGSWQLSKTGYAAETNAVYAGEENITQAGFNTSTLFGAAAGSASFDEILSGTDAGAIAGLFIK